MKIGTHAYVIDALGKKHSGRFKGRSSIDADKGIIKLSEKKLMEISLCRIQFTRGGSAHGHY